LSVYLCYSGKLFLESGLNIFYVIIGIYGWYQWKHGSKENAALKIIPSTINKNILLMGIGMALWIPFALVAKNYSTQALPYLDAFITAFSLVATWMTAKKILENWLYWIVIDALAAVLYANRGFYLIALLYIIYTILALVGYIKWKKTITT
jgi:nicotinamide mononucleotide transporter